MTVGSPKAKRSCPACGAAGEGAVHHVPELYLGLRTTFPYWECPACGTLALAEPPQDLGRYYPSNYYAFSPRNVSRAGELLRGLRDGAYLASPGLARRVAGRWVRVPHYMTWLDELKLPRHASILDVGCGSGALCAALQGAGFRVLGIDAFVERGVDFANGAKVRKLDLAGVEGQFDCVMLHHSLEHMPDPDAAFAGIARVVAPGGKVLVRTPVAGAFAWRTYGVHWFQLDAPRHLVVFSEKGLRGLAARHGFAVRRVVYDSMDSQFWRSIEYSQGIGPTNPRSHLMNPNASQFAPAQLVEFRTHAESLNAAHDGDQAAFYLERVS